MSPQIKVITGNFIERDIQRWLSKLGPNGVIANIFAATCRDEYGASQQIVFIFGYWREKEVGEA